MDGNPIDPIPLERAVNEAWERLAGNAGLNVKEYILDVDHDRSPELQRDRREYVERLEELRKEAQLRVWGLTLIGELRAWTGEGEDWKRPTEKVLRSRLTSARDEPSGLYVDRQDVAAVLAARWPDEFARTHTERTRIDGRVRGPIKRGRPPGSGSYEADDAPLLLEMAELIKARIARSPNAAAQIVAERAPGASFESKVKRLRDAYMKSHLSNGD